MPLLLRRFRAAMRTSPEESGMSLVELIVASAISVLLLAIIGSLFVKTMQTQVSVTDTSHTSNSAKVAFDDLQASVRLAVETDVRVPTAMGVDPSTGRGSVLVLKTRANQGAVAAVGTWRCVGWYLDPSKRLHKLVRPAQASGTPPTAVSPSSWPVVASGVTTKASGGLPFLALDPDPDTEAWYPGSITVALNFQEGTSKVPVGLSSTIVPRRQLQLDGEVSGGVACV
jgi:type II secretory pathway pseudopilin PulG